MRTNSEVKRSCLKCHAAECAEIVLKAEVEAVKRLDGGRISRFYQRGETLYRQGETLSGLFCISSAQVKLVALSQVGKVQIVGLAGPGQLLGLSLMVSGQKAPHSAMIMKSGVVCNYQSACVKAALGQGAILNMNLLRALARDQSSAEDRLLSLGGLSAPARISKAILELSQPNGQVLALTRTEFAQLASTSTETVSRLLHSLARAGSLKLKGRQITLLKPADLEAIVATG
ncbi:Crp/Fnr family transcriptional regulator [bacterium]|nr:Crp/Fnr family transcriptional regulator [bacterium]